MAAKAQEVRSSLVSTSPLVKYSILQSRSSQTLTLAARLPLDAARKRSPPVLLSNSLQCNVSNAQAHDTNASKQSPAFNEGFFLNLKLYNKGTTRLSTFLIVNKMIDLKKLNKRKTRRRERKREQA
ncbi:hypothetical protein WMY93_031475 [Mugilogobius chulae]|uniref:Uncharacterized protein n=1 Tax=Mugilogobius chulae TaxID=88201 RepID=A0AAW0MM92_9GOBI